MKSIPDFLKHLNKNCLRKKYTIRGNFNSSNVYSFSLFYKDKKVQFTHKFDNTCLKECQTIIYETDNLFITAIELSKNLLPKIDEDFLSRDGVKLKKLLKGN